MSLCGGARSCREEYKKKLQGWEIGSPEFSAVIIIIIIMYLCLSSVLTLRGLAQSPSCLDPFSITLPALWPSGDVQGMAAALEL